MSELSHIQMFVFLILMLQFTVTLKLSSVTVRAGDDVTLTCEHVKDEQDECQNIEWIYFKGENDTLDVLVTEKQIEASRSNRLRLGEKCSLVIKNVTHDDAGLYSCPQKDIFPVMLLSVVSLTEVEVEHRIHFYCYVSTYAGCRPLVFLTQDKVFIGQRYMKPSHTGYYAIVSFEESQFNSPMMNSLTCEVIDCSSNVHQFLFRPQASDNYVKPVTTESSTSVTTVRISSTTGEDKNPAMTQVTPGWWRIIIVSVGLTALIITVITVDIWIRTKGNKTQMNQTTVDEDEDEGDDTVKYEHVGVSSASV